MHFEFKSTFRISAIQAGRLLLAFGTHLLRQRAWLILAFNLLAATTLAILYLQNHFIPAVYGAKPSGHLWIKTFKTLGLSWALSTTYAACILSSKLPFINALRRLSSGYLNNAFVTTREECRVAAIQFVLVFTLLRSIANHEYDLVPLVLHDINRKSP